MTRSQRRRAMSSAEAENGQFSKKAWEDATLSVSVKNRKWVSTSRHHVVIPNLTLSLCVFLCGETFDTKIIHEWSESFFLVYFTLLWNCFCCTKNIYLSNESVKRYFVRNEFAKRKQKKFTHFESHKKCCEWVESSRVYITFFLFFFLFENINHNLANHPTMNFHHSLLSLSPLNLRK